MIYAILTTSLSQSFYDIRKIQYTNGINVNTKMLNNIPNIKIVIVENNGLINSFLDDFNYEVIYTDNNDLDTTNKGHKELMDILDVIKKLDIKDDDFVIKLTARYIIDNNCNFINSVINMDNNIDCIIKYGSHDDRVIINRVEDCITGLIGMKAKYIKQIDTTNDSECIEWKWARVANTIPDDRIIMLKELGIYIIGFHEDGPNNIKK